MCVRPPNFAHSTSSSHPVPHSWLFPSARQRPGTFGSNNSTVSDSKTSRNIEPSPPHILARFVSPHYVLFPKVKLNLKGARFGTIEEIQKAVTDQLNKIPSEDFYNAMKKSETRANLCITSNGSYFDYIKRKKYESSFSFSFYCLSLGTFGPHSVHMFVSRYLSIYVFMYICLLMYYLRTHVCMYVCMFDLFSM